MSKYLQIVDGLLTEEECQHLIDFANKREWNEVDRGIASYSRVENDNPDLAKFYLDVHPIK